MKYFVIEPEVAGSLGSDTILDRSTHPPIVNRLEFRFEGWLGDPIVESFPVFLARSDLVSRFKAIGITGYQIADAKITISDDLKATDPKLSIPPFEWVQIIGKSKHDDFFLAVDFRLVISEKVKAAVEEYGVKYWSIEEYEPN